MLALSVIFCAHKGIEFHECNSVMFDFCWLRLSSISETWVLRFLLDVASVLQLNPVSSNSIDRGEIKYIQMTPYSSESWGSKVSLMS